MADTPDQRSDVMDAETRALPEGEVEAPVADQTEPGTEPAETMPKSLCDWLGQLLGDAFTMYVQAHGYHWNVAGVQFSQYHDLFAEIADDVHGSVDAIAENILKLGYDAPATMAQLVAFRELDDPDSVPDSPVAMATALLAANMIVLDTLNAAFEQATIENQQGVANFLADRIDAHQKWSWQLRKSIDAQPQDTMLPTGDETIVENEPADEAGDSVERAYSPVRIQYRSSGAGKQYRVIQGYAARFNSMSDDLGGFREIIAPGAFRNAIKSNDIRLLYNHDTASVLARTGVNLELAEDDMGLRMWARVDMSDPDVARVASKLEQGLVDAASFGFTVKEDSWDDRSGYPIRTIREIDTLWELTICAWPAYPATRMDIMDDAIRSGRLHLGGAAHTAPEMVGAASRDSVSGTGTLSAAAWRARLSLRQHETRKYLP